MSKDKLEKGDLVRIISNLRHTKTEKYYTIAYEMKSMQGKEYRIKEVESDIRIRIYDPDAGRDFVFHAEDLTLVESLEIPSMVFNFDPATLHL